jgi:cell division protein WhiA
MSFTSEIKKELTQNQARSCCKRAELSALIRMNGVIELKKQGMVLNIPTENPATARYLFSLLKQLYSVKPEVLVRKKVRLKRNNVYVIRLSSQTNEVLTNLYLVNPGTWEFVLGISPSLFLGSCCKRAYLRGAFLASGSVNNPDSTSYHLEIVSTYYDHGKALCDLMNDFHLHVKMIERKKGFVVYIKEGDKIGEFLNIIGAHPALLQFENVRIMKDMRNSVNRLVNCETANLNKVIRASMRQIENIEFIEQQLGLHQLSKKLQEVAEARLKYPELNLTELGQLLPSGKVSKSTINHRLRKLDDIAHRLRLKEYKK